MSKKLVFIPLQTIASIICNECYTEDDKKIELTMEVLLGGKFYWTGQSSRARESVSNHILKQHINLKKIKERKIKARTQGAGSWLKKLEKEFGRELPVEIFDSDEGKRILQESKEKTGAEHMARLANSFKNHPELWDDD